MASNGTDYSTSNSTVPMISVTLRVHFSNGVAVPNVDPSGVSLPEPAARGR